MKTKLIDKNEVLDRVLKKREEILEVKKIPRMQRAVNDECIDYAASMMFLLHRSLQNIRNKET
jgi:hypothetical protein